MKTVRIEITVTARVHCAEAIDDKTPPAGTPGIAETFRFLRVVDLIPSFSSLRTCASEASNLHETVKAHTVSMLGGMASVLPEKLGHAARDFA
jgi:hypothetical protein